jgi:hypothetical protein
MGTIANKRGGIGGRNVPPTVVAPFAPIPGKGEPLKAVLILVCFLLVLSFIGLVIWGAEALSGEKWFKHDDSEFYYHRE